MLNTKGILHKVILEDIKIYSAFVKATIFFMMILRMLCPAPKSRNYWIYEGITQNKPYEERRQPQENNGMKD